jgi:hypothetical protein
MIFQPLCSSFTASWSCLMTRSARLTRRFEFRIRMISPYIRRLLPRISILAVCNRISRQLFNKAHFSHSASWIFNKENFWLNLIRDNVNNMFINLITKLSVIRDWLQLLSLFILFSMVSNSSDTIACTIWTHPDNIRDTTAQLQDIFFS